MISLRLHFHGRRLHHVAHQPAWRRRDETGHGYDTAQCSVRLDGVHLVQLALVLRTLAAQGFDGFAEGGVLAYGDDVGGHEPTGRILGIVEQRVDAGAVGEFIEDRLPIAGRQLGHEIRRVVGRHLLDELRRVLRADREQHLFGMLGRFHLRERTRRELHRQLRDDPHAMGFVERRENVGQIRGVNVARPREERVQVVLLGELLQLVEPEIRRLRHRHAWFPPPRAIGRTGPGRTAMRSTRVALAARISNSSPFSVKRSPARGILPRI